MNESEITTHSTPAEPLGTSGETVAEITPPATAAQQQPERSEPTIHFARPTGRYTLRFALLYTGLGAVLVGAVAGLAVLVFKPGSGPSVPWSSWVPSKGTTAVMTNEIAQHVAHEYHLNKAGSQLVAVVSGPPRVTSGTHKIVISNIVVRNTAKNAGIETFSSARTWSDQFCGLGASCSISSGHPSLERGRLVRREALEVALYTFRFVPAIDSIVAFMPPPPGTTATTLLYLQKSALEKQLSEPLDKTLTLKTPPLPTSADPQEASTIDKLTLPSIYSYSLQALQDNSALLVLDPAP